MDFDFNNRGEQLSGSELISYSQFQDACRELHLVLPFYSLHEQVNGAIIYLNEVFAEDKKSHRKVDPDTNLVLFPQADSEDPTKLRLNFLDLDTTNSFEKVLAVIYSFGFFEQHAAEMAYLDQYKRMSFDEKFYLMLRRTHSAFNINRRSTQQGFRRLAQFLSHPQNNEVWKAQSVRISRKYEILMGAVTGNEENRRFIRKINGFLGGLNYGRICYHPHIYDEVYIDHEMEGLAYEQSTDLRQRLANGNLDIPGVTLPAIVRESLTNLYNSSGAIVENIFVEARKPGLPFMVTTDDASFREKQSTIHFEYNPTYFDYDYKKGVYKTTYSPLEAGAAVAYCAGFAEAFKNAHTGKQLFFSDMVKNPSTEKILLMCKAEGFYYLYKYIEENSKSISKMPACYKEFWRYFKDTPRENLKRSLLHYAEDYSAYNMPTELY